MNTKFYQIAGALILTGSVLVGVGKATPKGGDTSERMPSRAVQSLYTPTFEAQGTVKDLPQATIPTPAPSGPGGNQEMMEQIRAASEVPAVPMPAVTENGDLREAREILSRNFENNIVTADGKSRLPRAVLNQQMEEDVAKIQQLDPGQLTQAPIEEY